MINPFKLSTEWYRDITGQAHRAPEWVQETMVVVTDGALLLFAVIFVALWWRARHAEARRMALTLLSPMATVISYMVSKSIKSFVRQERPCHVLLDIESIAQCPPAGDWSFPSNHAAIAAAAAASIIVVWPRAAAVVVPVAAMIALSRVFVGVHYPHDVLFGAALGAGSALLTIFLLLRPAIALVSRVRLIRASRVRSKF